MRFLNRLAAAFVLLFAMAWVLLASADRMTFQGGHLESVSAQSGEYRVLAQVGGASHVVEAAGDYVLLGVGPCLTVLSIDPAGGLSVVGRTEPLPGVVTDIALSGTTVFVAFATGVDEAMTGGIVLIDVQSPAQPSLISVTQTRPIKGLAVTESGFVLAVGTGDWQHNTNRLQGVFSVYEREGDALAERAVLSFHFPAVDVTLRDDEAYVLENRFNSTEVSALRVIDVSDPLKPIKQQVLMVKGYPEALGLGDESVLIAAGSAGVHAVQSGLESAVGFQTVGQRWDPPGCVSGIANGPGIIALTNPCEGSVHLVEQVGGELWERGRIRVERDVVDAAWIGEQLVLARGDEGGADLVRFVDGAWRVVSSHRPGGSLQDVVYTDGRIIGGNVRYGLAAYRSDDFALVDRLSLRNVKGIVVRSGGIVASYADSNALELIQVQPNLVTTGQVIDVGFELHDMVALSESRLLASGGTRGLATIDLQRGEVIWRSPAGLPWGSLLAALGQRVVSLGSELVTYDLQEDGSLVQLGSRPTSFTFSSASDLAITERQALITWTGLGVFLSGPGAVSQCDISDPVDIGAPAVLRELNWPWSVRAAHGLIAVGSSTGVAIYDESGPGGALRDLAFVPVAGTAQSIDISQDGRVYVADGDGGLVVLGRTAERLELGAAPAVQRAPDSLPVISPRVPENASRTLEDVGLQGQDQGGEAIYLPYVSASSPIRPYPRLVLRALEGNSSLALAAGPELIYAGEGASVVVLRSGPDGVERIYRSEFLRGTVSGMHLSDERLYVAAGVGGLAVFDLERPELPKLIAQVPTGDMAIDVDASDELAFVTAMDAGLEVFDLRSEPPERLTTLPVDGRANEIYRKDDVAYVSTVNWMSPAIIDISTPQRPRMAGLLGEALGSGGWGSALVGISDYLYAFSCGNCFEVFNVSNALMPRHVAPEDGAFLDIDTSIATVDRAREKAFLSDLGDMTVLDLKDPERPVVETSEWIGTNVTDLVVQGDRLLASHSLAYSRDTEGLAFEHGPGGVIQFDADDCCAPQEFYSPTLGMSIVFPSAHEGRALYAWSPFGRPNEGPNNDNHEENRSRWSGPIQRREERESRRADAKHETLKGLQSVSQEQDSPRSGMDDMKAWEASPASQNIEGEIFVIDFSDPEQPVLGSRIDTPIRPGLQVAGDFGYQVELGAGARRIDVYDLTEPARPSLAGDFTLPEVPPGHLGWPRFQLYGHERALLDTSIYTREASTVTLAILDVAAAPKVERLGEITFAGRVAHSTMDEHRLYVVVNQGDITALRVFDVRSQPPIQELGALELPEELRFMRALALPRDDTLAVVTREGVTTIDVTDPTQPRVGAPVTGRTPNQLIELAPYQLLGIGDGTFLIDMKDQRQPRLVSAFDPAGHVPTMEASQVAQRDGWLYLNLDLDFEERLLSGLAIVEIVR